jgi:predicted Zn-dependent protease
VHLRFAPVCIRLCLAGSLLCAALFQAAAPAKAFWGENQPALVYQTLPEVENALYGHAYPDQSSGQRISRVEKTLFGSSVSGPLEPRMARINEKMQERTARASQTAQEPMIAYLEEKLFQRTFTEKSLPERIRQLEVQVFGRSFEQYPLPIRIKKLTYAMPLMAKEIRLTKGETVIARAENPPYRPYRKGSVSETAQPDIPMRFQHTEEPVKVRTGDDYFSRIHRSPNGLAFRWAQLPVRVYFKNTAAESALSQQAVDVWQKGFPLELVSTPQQADVIISWDKADWDQNPSTLLTRPVVRLSDNSTVRTVVLITAYPVRNIPAEQLRHILSHQLGHAFGLWGHSDNPEDLMYPALKWETADFPARWRWRSESGLPPSNFNNEILEPSPRDMNTLLRIYEQPASDLSVYTP